MIQKLTGLPGVARAPTEVVLRERVAHRLPPLVEPTGRRTRK